MKFDFSINEKEFRKLKTEVKNFMSLLKHEVDAQVFLGGSFAKRTVAESEEYDADIFVRYDWRYDDLSDMLEKTIKKISKKEKMEFKRMHGSRDYFRVWKDKKLTFEVIPVTKIKNVKMARNVTDLSYFHVNFVNRHLKGKLAKEAAIAKKFFKAQGVYGAESYIHGFSGYGLECLIIHYKSFEKMLKELVKIKDKRIVIDIRKFYKRKEDVFFELNESKLQSPIILVDPTWKERNVLASLSWETFRKLQKAAKKFLKNPKERYFHRDLLDVKRLRSLKGEFLKIELETSRQEGDIAGTKMKKFAGFLMKKIKEYFVVLREEFEYPGEGQKSVLYLVLKPRKEVIKVGPPVVMKKETASFRKKNGKTFVRSGIIHSREKVSFSAKNFLGRWVKSKEGKIKLKDMCIDRIRIGC